MERPRLGSPGEAAPVARPRSQGIVASRPRGVRQPAARAKTAAANVRGVDTGLDIHGLSVTQAGQDRHGTAVRSTRPGFQPGPPLPCGPAATAWTLAQPPLDEVAAVVAPEFDAAFYHASHQDVRESGMDPLQHFLLYGATELRNPNRHFDSRFYMEANPDVHDTGMNGFWHFLVQGRAQGRAPRRSREAERQAFLRARPPSERPGGQLPAVVACMTPAALHDALQARLPGAQGLTLAVSHDRYTRHVGGVQILVADEQAAFNARGEAYLHIAPVASRMVLAPEGTGPFYIHVTLDGVYLGVTTYTGLQRLLIELLPALPAVRRLVLHCLLGHQVHALIALHEALAPRDAVFWVNDYESICVGFNLLRNDVAYCGAPPPDSGACRVCVYGAERGEHLAHIQALFAAVPLHVVAPSAAALAVWRHGARLPHLSAQVHEYAAVKVGAVRSAMPDAPPRGTPANPVRVAFVGYPTAHKGWDAFAELASQMAGLAAYQLFHFTAAPPGPPLPGVVTLAASVTPAARGAMTEALVAQGIDLVLVLSSWPETFCLVAYEAMAAGADIVTLSASGNVADMVLASGRGLVMQDLPALIWFFKSEDAVRYARLCGASGSEMGQLASLGMTATLALPDPP